MRIVSIVPGTLTDPLLDPPLNIISFMISVKFRLMGDTQILSGSSGIIGLKTES